MRLLIIVFFLVLPACGAKTQDIWGVKAGLNVATLGSGSINKPRLGYHLATYYAQHIESQYGWQIGLQYSLQGARVNNSANGRLAYHYLSMPLLMKLYFGRSSYLEVGPQLAYLLQANYLETGFKEDKTATVRRWDFSGIAGLGYETASGGIMGLRFALGFLNTSGASVGNTVVFRNLVLQLYVGFKIKELNE